MMEDPLKILEQVEKVDAPPFLFTRIQQKIAGAKYNRVSPKLAWAIGLGFILLIAVNGIALNSISQNSSTAGNLAESLQLTSQHSLYP